MQCEKVKSEQVSGTWCQVAKVPGTWFQVVKYLVFQQKVKPESRSQSSQSVIR